MTQSLQIETTPIPGLLVLRLPVPGDNRGWFKENWQRSKMVAAGLPDFAPVQNNISFNIEPGVTRGIHAEPWDKYVSVAAGKVFGAWVDLREGDTYGQSFAQEIGPDVAVFVPRGVGNGFQCLEANTAYTYLVNDHWSAEAVSKYVFVNLDDPTIDLPWPLPIDRTKLSQADQNHPMLEQALNFKAPKIAVVGANGQLGRSVVAALGERALPLSRADLDIADPVAMKAFDWSGVSAIVNCAAYTSVDLAETPEGRVAAWAINAHAVTALAASALEHHLQLIHVSTDYVYDGSEEMVKETDPTAPLGVYGQSKAAGEFAVSLVPGHSIIRTSWMFGAGANFVRTMYGLRERGIAPGVVNDQFGRLTYAPDLADFIVHLLGDSSQSGTFNFSGSGDIVSWYDVASQIWTLSGGDASDVSAVSATEFGAGKNLAPRPKYSSFDLTRVEATGFKLPDHLQRLAEYVRDLSASKEEAQ